MKKRTRLIAWIFGMALGMVVVSEAQVEQQARPKAPGSVYAQLIAFASDSLGVTRVDQYVQVPYSELSFVAKDDGYIARFELAVQILNVGGIVAWQRTQSVELQVKDFAQTVSDRLTHLRQLSALLPPGTYEYQLQVSDVQSRRTANLKRSFVVRDLQSDVLTMSDIILARRVSEADGKKAIIPNVSAMFGSDADRFHLFFEAYSKRSFDSLALAYRIIDVSGNLILEERRVQQLLEGTTPIIWSVDSIPVMAGSYRILVSLTPLGVQDGSVRPVEVPQTFTVSWRGLPTSIKDITKAIEQLRYIAESDEIDRMLESNTDDGRMAQLQAFWAKRDPDAQTPRNELMEEYYSRVAYANEHFAHYMEGWRTDMGMVYIRFGPPENVERHPFETDRRPYEVWYYYEQNRQFVFVDESGFGDYRLRYPTTDLWGRIR